MFTVKKNRKVSYSDAAFDVLKKLPKELQKPGAIAEQQAIFAILNQKKHGYKRAQTLRNHSDSHG